MEGVVKQLAENNHILERQAIVFPVWADTRNRLNLVHFVDPVGVTKQKNIQKLETLL